MWSSFVSFWGMTWSAQPKATVSLNIGFAKLRPELNTSPESLGSDQVAACFERCFAKTDNTQLRGGASEPLYEPGEPAIIWFRHDYLRSALHEAAHWCLAGAARRKLQDYGYWYSEDDRCAVQQAAFFAVEAKPQAIEKLFCEALSIPFSISVDNLSLQLTVEERQQFERRVAEHREHYLNNGMPIRAQRFVDALKKLVAAPE